MFSIQQLAQCLFSASKVYKSVLVHMVILVTNVAPEFQVDQQTLNTKPSY